MKIWLTASSYPCSSDPGWALCYPSPLVSYLQSSLACNESLAMYYSWPTLKDPLNASGERERETDQLTIKVWYRLASGIKSATELRSKHGTECRVGFFSVRKSTARYEENNTHDEISAVSITAPCVLLPCRSFPWVLITKQKIHIQILKYVHLDRGKSRYCVRARIKIKKKTCSALVMAF